MADLSQSQWLEKLLEDDNALILDVRTELEISEGIIPNAIHIDIYKGQDFVYEVNKLDKTKSFFIYCRSGIRSGQACAIMNQLGFSETYNLVGGIIEWTGDIVNN